eukprot:359765-Chlamydomonas_euryale.AAC.4
MTFFLSARDTAHQSASIHTPWAAPMHARTPAGAPALRDDPRAPRPHACRLLVRRKDGHVSGGGSLCLAGQPERRGKREEGARRKIVENGEREEWEGGMNRRKQGRPGG